MEKQENQSPNLTDAVIEPSIAKTAETAETNQSENPDETSALNVDSVKNLTSSNEAQAAEANSGKPGVEDILRAVITDDRVGHFIVDVLSGRNVIESISERFNISGVKQAVVDTLVNEAEERGYLRGRNETIEAKMSEPGMWQSSTSSSREEAERKDRNPFLQRVRRSVWD